ncbi:hypothetical protein [Ideonella sp.]|jgi:hypothetical protein|uniref:hypothetical protein n=1 Tax=Ideonella sp. TaxID=1929293 RepID=UPI0037C1677C
MQIDAPTARRFIQAYMAFLGSLLPEQRKQGLQTTQWLVQAREVWQADPSLLLSYRRAQADQAVALDEPMLDAIAQMRMGRWIYLKDTRSYSVFLDAQATQAYAVLGLTQRLRDVGLGGSGVTFTAGLVPLNGRWVCDGLLAEPLTLGPNYRREFNAQAQALRQQGLFSERPKNADSAKETS